jgi:hypothetical protein
MGGGRGTGGKVDNEEGGELTRGRGRGGIIRTWGGKLGEWIDEEGQGELGNRRGGREKREEIG